MTVNTIKSPINLDKFEIVKSGTVNAPAVSISAPASQYVSAEITTTIFHGLGYTPTLILTLSDPAITFSSTCPFFTFAPNIWETYQGYADSTNLYILSDIMGYNGTSVSFAAGVFIFQYYLLREKVKRAI